jgi:hypothetical protein
MQVFDVAQLKLFLSELARPSDVVALAEAQARVYRRRLAELEAVAARFADRPARMQSVPFGRRLYQMAEEFWETVAIRSKKPNH